MEMKKLGQPVTEEMEPFEAFTMKSFFDDALSLRKPHLWYSFGDVFKNVSFRLLVGCGCNASGPNTP